MSSNTYTLTCTSKLSEDYIHATSIFASPSAPTPMATFINSQGQSEALLIHDDGELCHLQREPLSSSGWNIYGIGALLETITAANSGSVWVTGSDHTIWQSNAGHWNYITTLKTGAPDISVGLDGTVYALGELGDSYHLFVFDSTTQEFVDNGVQPITSAPVGSAGSLWAIASSQLVTNTTVPGALHRAGPAKTIRQARSR